MRILALMTVLALSGTIALAQDRPQAAAAKTYSSNPDGKGDPTAITCRHPQALPGKRLLGPEVCRNNADWAQFAKDGVIVSPDGTTLLPSEKQRSLNPAACGPTAGSAPTTNAMSASRGGMTC